MRNMVRNLALHTLLTGVPAFLCAAAATELDPTVVIRADRDIAAALELAAPYEMTARIGGGSGTLIAPHWVLTAAHVASGLSPLDPFVEIEGDRYRVERIATHPEGVSDGRRPPRVDLALLRLAEPVKHVTPASIHRGRKESGSAVTVVGYGDFGTAGAKLAMFDGKRRAATNIIDAANERHVVIDFDEPDRGTELEGVGAPGDSGGPMFIDVDGQPQLVGVSSASMGGRPGQYGLRDLYVRVSQYADWIDDTMNAHPVAGQAVSTPRDIRRLGFPETDAARLTASFIEGCNAAVQARLVEFSQAHRLEGARRDRPDAAWASMIVRMHNEHGTLEPVLYVVVPRGVELLVRNAETKRLSILRLMLQERQGALKLDGHRLRVLDKNHPLVMAFDVGG